LSGVVAAYFTDGDFDPSTFEMEGLEVGPSTTEVNLVIGKTANKENMTLLNSNIVTKNS